jgi:DNA-directed RNA polymerase specialized sigma24 family protein
LTAREATAVRTRDEIADAIRGLSPAQWARLRLVAVRYAWRGRSEPEDLLQEAFCRALEDDGRDCPQHVDVVKFLAEAMRSIADGEADKRKNQVTVVPIGAVDPEDHRLNAEDAIDNEQKAAAIRCAILALFVTSGLNLTENRRFEFAVAEAAGAVD